MEVSDVAVTEFGRFLEKSYFCHLCNPNLGTVLAAAMIFEKRELERAEDGEIAKVLDSISSTLEGKSLFQGILATAVVLNSLIRRLYEK